MTTPPWFPVVHSALSLLHDPPYEILSGKLQPYFESPQRYHNILAALLPPDASSPGPRLPPFTPYLALEQRWTAEEVSQPWLIAAIKAVHMPEYLDYLEHIYEEWVAEGGAKEAVLAETFLRSDLLMDPAKPPKSYHKKDGAIEKAGRFSFDLSAPVMEGTWVAALASCRVALEAARLLREDASLSGAFALCRPPGHHSGECLAGGYCFISNAALATKYLQQEKRFSKIAILDIDYHHGNGTAKIFYDDPSVFYVSLHGSPDYPYYTGSADETGSGPGLGTTLNYPLPLGTDNFTYHSTLRTAVKKVSDWKPDVCVVSLGVDTFKDDPLTDFKLTLGAYPEIGRIIGGLGVQTLFVMEGGYCLEKIGGCVRGVLDGYIDARRRR